MVTFARFYMYPLTISEFFQKDFGTPDSCPQIISQIACKNCENYENML